MQFTKREKVVMREAFIMGRLYVAGGEREDPADIDALVAVQCEWAVIRQSSYQNFLRRILWRR